MNKKKVDKDNSIICTRSQADIKLFNGISNIYILVQVHIRSLKDMQRKKPREKPSCGSNDP